MEEKKDMMDIFLRRKIKREGKDWQLERQSPQSQSILKATSILGEKV